MNLLITPAFPGDKQNLQTIFPGHSLYFIHDERISILNQNLDFDPSVIDGIVCNFFFVYNDLSVLPNLKFIQLTSVGLDRVPLDEIKRRGIQLFNAGAAYAVPMAEWAIAKILEVYKAGRFFHANQQQKKWEKNRAIQELYDSKVSIIGFGNLGREIAKRLKSFGAVVTAVDIFEVCTSDLADHYYPIGSLNQALKTADVVILCLPLTEATCHMMNSQTLSLLKSDALLINLSRGKLVNEEAVYEYLCANPDFRFAADVFEAEPLPETSPLWDMEQVLISPHNSFVGNHNNRRLQAIILKNIENFR